jgi:hypothetical protein
MAHPTRFPPLALPFAIVGAAGGWLSASLLSNPMLRMTWPGKEWAAALVAMVLAGGAGALITRWCVGKRYAYELDTPDPEARVHSDRWPRHVTVVLVAGTATGLAVSLLYATWRGPLIGALCGLVCALAFVPVCALVILAARRAQRARLGSIVSASDRRAVWGILATALSATTLEALPDWPAAWAGDTAFPLPALAMTLAAGLVIAVILVADSRALRLARSSAGQGLTARDPSEPEAVDTTVPRLDLGLGEDAWARLARSASAYRGRDRTLALIQGSPSLSEGALRRAIRRGTLGLVVTFAVAAAHAGASGPQVSRLYSERRCAMDDFAACTRAAEQVSQDRLDHVVELYEKACEGSDADGCLALAKIFEAFEALERPMPQSGQSTTGRKSVYYHQRACDAGVSSSCQRGAAPLRYAWFPLKLR